MIDSNQRREDGNDAAHLNVLIEQLISLTVCAGVNVGLMLTVPTPLV